LITFCTKNPPPVLKNQELWNDLASLCRYCYANADSRLVLENMKLHNPDSPLLIGELTPDDKIFNTAQKSWIVD
jgi:hypothetical protein